MRALLFASAFAATALSACGSETRPPGPAAAACSADSAVAMTAVSLRAFTFQPSCFTVPVGVAVTFANYDEVPHDIVADADQPESFDSGIIPTGGRYVHTFSAAGVVTLRSNLYNSMRATALVTRE